MNPHYVHPTPPLGAAPAGAVSWTGSSFLAWPWFSVVVLFLLAGCFKEKDPAEQRLAYAEKSEGPVRFAVAWPEEVRGDQIRHAMEMAREEILRTGGIDGRDLQLEFFDDQADVTRGRVVAQRIIEDPGILAVVGHFNSYITVGNANIYELENLVVMNPASLSDRVNDERYQRVFTHVPNARQIGRTMAAHARDHDYQRLLVYYVRDAYGRSIANFFEDSATELGLRIVARMGYDPGSYRKIRTDMDQIKRLDIDAVVLIGEPPEAVEFVRLLREAGLTPPIINDDGFYSPEILELPTDLTQGIVLFSPLYLGDPGSHTGGFVRRFEEEYGEPPIVYAAQVYDAILTLAEAYRQSPTLLPGDVAATLRSRPWSTFTGEVEFDQRGEVRGRPLEMIRIEDGRFVR